MTETSALQLSALMKQGEKSLSFACALLGDSAQLKLDISASQINSSLTVKLKVTRNV